MGSRFRTGICASQKMILVPCLITLEEWQRNYYAMLFIAMDYGKNTAVVHFARIIGPKNEIGFDYRWHWCIRTSLYGEIAPRRVGNPHLHILSW